MHRFAVLRKLEWGVCSTVWLVRDEVADGDLALPRMSRNIPDQSRGVLLATKAKRWETWLEIHWGALEGSTEL
ncbi:hypothetical protein BDV98DRAFT_658117 [Pterulicium gracile]|uniref:Uncharacterized protein n=1 Tax=Pterulicium gracile TaxID=1884261 RepID=A0A5C3QAJ8_9AGAR|nr:hypothetical protein BDV98DRAFT_658117 [Pterula gracilis]